MTKEQYLKALKKLHLTPASQTTVRVLGMSLRQIQAFKSGEQTVPQPVALLLRMYLQHGIPADLLAG
jgi:hypothetical protein